MNAVEYEIFQDELRVACQTVAKKWGVEILPSNLLSVKEIETRAFRRGLIAGQVPALIALLFCILVIGV